MGRIDDALVSLRQLENETERALQLAGLISTLFKIRGVALIVTGRLAFDSYANTTTSEPELELATFAGKTTPRMLQEIMGGQLHGEGLIHRWKVAGIPIRLQESFATAHPALCRDFMTDHGVVKLIPAEEITAERILASAYPVPNAVAHEEARQLLINALTDAFKMDWTVLGALCHLPEYRVGEELAQLRAQAKQEADAQGLGADPVGQVPPPPAEGVESTEETPEIPSESSPSSETPKLPDLPTATEQVVDDIITTGVNAL
jgi:hypothetical protein